MNITKTQIESLYTNLAVLNRNINVMSEYAKQLKIEIDSIVSNQTSSKKKCRTNSNQIDLFNNEFKSLDYVSRSTGFEDSVNPARQVIGQKGGLATLGIKRAHVADRRERGSVNIKNMSVNEKRQYWRWTNYRRLCRKLGNKVVSWDYWIDGLA
jgi:hypothetical protein